jgi:hypothetical protein
MNLISQQKQRLKNLSEVELRETVYRFADLSSYSLKERLAIKAIGLVGFWCIAAIGRSIRWTVVDGHYHEELVNAGKRMIFTLWHNRILLATWYWRRRGIVVTSSRSYDAEYTARLIQRLGYGVAKGSSTRGGANALRVMMACMNQGIDTGFPIDGPRGPVYVAKRGAVALAKLTGQAILPFHISAEKFWEAKSWDRFQIPRPFTRAVVLLGKPIFVPPDADTALTTVKQQELQTTLDSLRERGDMWFH